MKKGSRDITLLKKVHMVKAVVFPAVTYRCESWTIQKAEHPRTDVLNLLIGKDSDAGKDRRQEEEKGMTEDEFE